MERAEVKKNHQFTCKRCKKRYKGKKRRCDKLFPGLNGYYCETCFHYLRDNDILSPSNKAKSKKSASAGQESFSRSEQERGQSNGEQVCCNFCGLGETADDVCGKLYKETVDGKFLAAHRKCMQYSAMLVQYTFDSFGGFKIDKVQEEIVRGRRLICSECRRRKTGVPRRAGATAGCALSKCKKSFHYYCAATSDVNQVSRRKCLNRKGREIDLYRIFCNPEHKEEYLAHSSGEQEHSSPETDKEDEGDGEIDGESGAKNNDLESDDTSNDSQGGAQENSMEEDLDEMEESNQNQEDEDDSTTEDADKFSVEVDTAKEENNNAENSHDSASFGTVYEENENSDGSDDNPYKSLPLTSSDSDSEVESYKQVKEKPTSKSGTPKVFSNKGKEKPCEKQTKSAKKSSKATEDLGEQAGTPSRKRKQEVVEESEDFSVDEMEMADRIKTSPRKKRRSKDQQHASNTRVHSSGKVKKRVDGSAAAQPEKPLHTRFTIDDFESDDSDAREDAFSEERLEPENNSTKAKAKRNGTVPEKATEKKNSLSKTISHDDAYAELEDDSSLIGNEARKNSTESKTKCKETTPDTAAGKKTLANSSQTSHDVDSEAKGERRKENPKSKVLKNHDEAYRELPQHQKESTPDTPTGKKTLARSSHMTSQASHDVESEAKGEKKKESPKPKVPKNHDEAERDLPQYQSQAKQGHRKSDSNSVRARADIHNASTASTLPECVLVIPLDVEKFQTVAAAACGQLAKDFSVDGQHVHDWSSLAPVLPSPGYMIHYLSDITIHLKTQNWTALGDLLTDQDMINQKMQEYKPKVEMYEEQDIEEGESNLLEIYVDTTKKLLECQLKKSKERTGAPVGEFTVISGVDLLALVISEMSDPENGIREKLHALPALFEWKQDIDFDPDKRVSKLQKLQNLTQEAVILQAWLSKSVTSVFQFDCLPTDVDLHLDVQPDEVDCFSQLKPKIEQLKGFRGHSDSDLSAVVLLFHRVNRKLLNFEPYLDAVLKRYLEEHKNRHIICILPACNFKSKGCPLQGFNSKSAELKVSSAHNPTERSVSFIVVEVKP